MEGDDIALFDESFLDVPEATAEIVNARAEEEAREGLSDLPSRSRRAEAPDRGDSEGGGAFGQRLCAALYRGVPAHCPALRPGQQLGAHWAA